MHVLALAIDLHLSECRSLKAKRSVLRPIIEGARSRFPVAVAETDWQDTWQRAQIGVVSVSSSAKLVRETIDEVERFIWSFPEAEVTEMRRHWMEEN